MSRKHRTTLAGWNITALRVRIAQYRKEGKNTRPYAAVLNRKVRALAATAVAACDTADQYELDGASRAAEYRGIAVGACEEFFEIAGALFESEKQAERFALLCAKAAPQAQVRHALTVLRIREVSRV